MTKEQIKREFERWINADCPRVFYKQAVWYVTNSPYWDDYKTVDFVVDDEYTKIRKAYIDGKTIEHKKCNGEWKAVSNPAWDAPVNSYRIHPAKVEVYQYIMYNSCKDKYFITKKYYKSAICAYEDNKEFVVIKPCLESKKEIYEE